MTTPAELDVEACPDGVLTVWEEAPLFSGDEPTVERIWILDVEGQRVVLDIGGPAHATDATVRQFTGIVRTATFVEG